VRDAIDDLVGGAGGVKRFASVVEHLGASTVELDQPGRDVGASDLQTRSEGRRAHVTNDFTRRVRRGL
jgi:hypothetical protein